MKMRCAVMLLGVAIALGDLTGCVPRKLTLPTTRAEAIRNRAEAHFGRVFYLKPAETDNPTAQAQQLAPLLIIETAATNALPDWPTGTTDPQVFFQPGQTILSGRPHRQMTYGWSYAKTFNEGPGALPAQGVRITLDSAGRPVIWEIFADTSRARVIFVAQSLELQAGREFGPPLAGRRFAVERSLTDAPQVVVARVIEDGPVPMGPILYLRAGTRDVTAVICRCMAAQARELAGQQEYELVLAPKMPVHFPKLEEIERRIRLPKNF